MSSSDPPRKESYETDDLTITVKDVDIAAWKAARKYGIDKGLSMGEVVTNALRVMLMIAEKDSHGRKVK